MTDRLYYSDPYCREFDAIVEAIGELDGRTTIKLSRTCFYPTSGGQPFDTGSLGPFRVVDVVDEDGMVVHVVETPAAPAAEAGPKGPALRVGPKGPALRVGPKEPALQVGQTIHGAIDWPRRFDHMQQHTGQHVLSAAFVRLFGTPTMSFHLGAAVSTIDLARELTPVEIGATEDEANRIVWEDRPVAIRFAGAEEAARLPLRKESLREGTLRLIDVDGFDLSACGGTHVSRTGAIGIISIGSWERFKGGQRIEFRCGGRALGRSRALRDTVSAAVRLLSVTPEELPASIERLSAEAKDQHRALATLREELSRYRAEALASSAEPTAKGRVVFRALDADAASLKVLATAISDKPGHAAVLVSASTPALVVIARAVDVSIAANQVLSLLTARFGGRGGGKPEIAQGGGLSGSPQAILEAARDALDIS